jgi:hypothetical protein
MLMLADPVVGFSGEPLSHPCLLKLDERLVRIHPTARHRRA